MAAADLLGGGVVRAVKHTFAELCADIRGPRRLVNLLRFCWALRRNSRSRCL